MTSVEWRRAVGATGLLQPFADAEVIDAPDIHVAQRLTTLAKETDESVALAIALVVRALRNGSVCVDLRSVEQQVGVEGLPWPAIDDWLAAVQASPLHGQATGAVGASVDGDLLYLDRYWLEEQQVCDDMRHPDRDEVHPGIAGYRPAVPAGLRGAARRRGNGAVPRADRADGRPGHRQDDDRREAAGPFGRAARSCGSRWRRRRARRRRDCRRRCSSRSTSSTTLLTGEALTGLHATTLHRLLGSRPDTSARFRHNRGNRLPHDVIVVDETSMVSLTMMARLLEAVRPDARLILVGDPDQLASVEAGRGARRSGRRTRRRERSRRAEDVAPVRRGHRRVGDRDPRG